MLLIVIYHVVYTLGSLDNPSIPYDPSLWAIDFGKSTASMQRFVLIIFNGFGMLGNDLFFICSAWFLCDRKTSNKRKLLYMASDVWVISIISLTAALIAGVPVSKSLMLKCLLPNICGNNWYITCYIIICLAASFLNIIIDHIDKRTHLAVFVTMDAMYLFACMIYSKLFFNSVLLIWIAMYFTVAYLKRYGMKFVMDRKKAITLGIGSSLVMLSIDILLNLAGLRYGSLSDKMLHFKTHNNGFYFLIALAAFMLAYQNKTFKSKIVNKLATLTLLIYILHENILFRTCARPLMFIKIKETVGYGNILGWVMVIAGCLYIASMGIGEVYMINLRKYVRRADDRIYNALKNRR